MPAREAKLISPCSSLILSRAAFIRLDLISARPPPANAMGYSIIWRSQQQLIVGKGALQLGKCREAVGIAGVLGEHGLDQQVHCVLLIRKGNAILLLQKSNAICNLFLIHLPREWNARLLNYSPNKKVPDRLEYEIRWGRAKKAKTKDRYTLFSLLLIHGIEA